MYSSPRAGAGESPYGLYTLRTRRIEPVGIRVVQRVLREVVALLVRHVAVVLVDVAELLVAPRRRARELAAVLVRAERRELRVALERDFMPRSSVSDNKGFGYGGPACSAPLV